MTTKDALDYLKTLNEDAHSKYLDGTQALLESVRLDTLSTVFPDDETFSAFLRELINKTLAHDLEIRSWSKGVYERVKRSIEFGAPKGRYEAWLADYEGVLCIVYRPVSKTR